MKQKNAKCTHCGHVQEYAFQYCQNCEAIMSDTVSKDTLQESPVEESIKKSASPEWVTYLGLAYVLGILFELYDLYHMANYYLRLDPTLGGGPPPGMENFRVNLLLKNSIPNILSILCYSFFSYGFFKRKKWLPVVYTCVVIIMFIPSFFLDSSLTKSIVPLLIGLLVIVGIWKRKGIFNQ